MTTWLLKIRENAQLIMCIVFAVWAFLATGVAIYTVLRLSFYKSAYQITDEHLEQCQGVNNENSKTIKGLAKDYQDLFNQLAEIKTNERVDYANWQSFQDRLERELREGTQQLAQALEGYDCADELYPAFAIERLRASAADAARSGGDGQAGVEAGTGAPDNTPGHTGSTGDTGPVLNPDGGGLQDTGDVSGRQGSNSQVDE